MTLIGCTTPKSINQSKLLGNLSEISTCDGSFSLYSSFFKEPFHSLSGALTEARVKFLDPSEINRFKNKDNLRVLDVCVGLGYNSALLIETIQNTSINLEWRGLEIDQRPLIMALKNNSFQKNWTQPVLNILQSLLKKSSWVDKNSKGEILWGDARRKLKLLPETFKNDLILLDAFSPGKCPQLWTEEFIKSLSQRLSPGGRIVTYCRAAAVRGSLRRAGLDLYSLKEPLGMNQDWSIGTMAILPETNKASYFDNSSPWQSLSQMEEEHLLTRAAIPYRDPNGIESSAKIIQRRKKEQINCSLESTSSWQKRWKLGKKS